MLAWTWGRWPDVLVDFSRELYVPWRMTEGQVLYRDVAYFAGPFSPSLDALWFRLFGVGIPFIHGSSPIGIGFSLVVVGVAAFNLVLDFDFIERGAAGRAPKQMEWYGAFALLVTLVWLYLEMLRLLAKLQERR